MIRRSASACCVPLPSLIISLAINVALLGSVVVLAIRYDVIADARGAIAARLGHPLPPAPDPYYRVATDLLELYAREPADVVMLGDSLTAGVDWSVMLDGEGRVLNHGVGGDTVAGFGLRLDPIIAAGPRLCLVMGGINDLRARHPVQGVFDDYVQVVEALRAGGVTPVIQSTLSVSPQLADHGRVNASVTELNRLLQAYAERDSLTFIDLTAGLSVDGRLRDEFTYDGLHLTADAYVVWAEAVQAVIDRAPPHTGDGRG